MNSSMRSIRVRSCRAGARGFALVSAIFLLVVLTTLGVAMLAFSTTQHLGSALDVEGARAYQAARAGAEWALYQRLEGPQKGTYCGAAGVAQTTSFALPAPTLSGYTVTVRCTLQNPSHAVPVIGPRDIDQISAAGGVAQVQTADVSDLASGMQVTIAGAAGYDGTHTIENVDYGGGLFTFFVAGAPAPQATGSFTARSQALDRRQIISIACNEPPCPNPNPSSRYVQRVIQVEF